MTRVFLDVDGVLADFIGGIGRLFGRPGYSPNGWDIHHDFQMTAGDFWGTIEKVGREFWANVDKTPECDEVIALLEKHYGAENICLLTSPSNDPQCLAGKLEWIQKHLPAYRRRYLMGAAKWFVAHGDAMLVDDSDANIESFTAFGGAGLLFPRPWNRNRMLDSLGFLRSSLEESPSC